jgi:hypothetical protein
MKMLTVFLFLVSSLLALDGAKVFEDNCKFCHFGMIKKADFSKQMKDVKAPPMIAISERLKETIVIKAQNENSEEIHRFTVISYIKEYLKKPSWDYYACSDRAINRFDVMPAQSHLNEEELQAVSEWIYDYFEDKKFH